ncbi:MAG: phage holin family protein [Jatrophihabitantaceae bacterium]
MTVTPQPDGAAASGRHAATRAPRAAGEGEPTVGQLVSDASANVSTIIQGEVALAKLELKSSVKNAGVGAGFFITAGVLLFFSLTFGLIALAEGINALGIWRWASYLIVFGFLLVLIALLVYLGVRKVKRVKAPKRTIDTGRDTVAYLKANTKRS